MPKLQKRPPFDTFKREREKKVVLPPSIHRPLIKLTRSMARIREVGHNAIHTDAVFISGIAARHIGPVPLEGHWHFPQILRDAVECLIELVHCHCVDVGVDAVDVSAGSQGQTLLLLEHLRCH